MAIRSSDLPKHVRRLVAQQTHKGKTVMLFERVPVRKVEPGGGALDSVTITLPLPSKVLSPNWHGPGKRAPREKREAAWRIKAREVKRYRRRAFIQTFQLADFYKPSWKTATIQATFYHPQHRRRDQMNLIGSLKAAEDGLVDSGLLADDEGVTWLPAIRCIDRDAPRVELTITKTGMP